MEIALDASIPTYSGGLGILAGDTLRSAADLELPMVAVSLVHRKGYFRQRLTPAGAQLQEPESWDPAQHLRATGVFANLLIEGRNVRIGIWQYDVRGITGHVVPAYLMDTAVEGNTADDQSLTDYLYGGDQHYRLQQEVLLGLGGLEVLRAVGHADISVYHMNEGHSSLLSLGLLEQRLRGRNSVAAEEDIVAVRRQCVFTTHTPVPAGHDKFPIEMVRAVLGEARANLLDLAGSYHDGSLNMTYLGLRYSHYINGVAMHHGEVSRGMFPEYPIHAITNGVHAVTWTSPPFQELYDRHLAEWRKDNLYLRYAIGIPFEEIADAHLKAKRTLIQEVKRRAGVELDDRLLTIGFARRATPYKRPELLFANIEKLKSIVHNVGPLQIVFAGKAHPADEGGKASIQHVFEAAAALRGHMPVVYLEDYDFRLGQLITSGVDLWLNTPQRPQEASGTSGMKAALNGVPSVSILDGWWIEGWIEGVTGWAIGDEEPQLGDATSEIASLYAKLEWAIVPMFYGRPAAYRQIMRHAIALNGSFFNTERMVSQYLANAYNVS
jgi:starch phosphorylase